MTKPKIPKKIFDIPIGKKLTINIFIIPIIVCAVCGGYIKIFVFAYMSAALHELAHVICAAALKTEVSQIRIYPFGFSAHLKTGYINSSEKEFFIAMAGPVCSLLIFVLFSFLNFWYAYPGFLYIADVNLALCAINLVPTLPLDGGRMLKSILVLRFGIIRAYNFMVKFSRILIIIMCTIAVSVFFVSNFNFSLCLISAFLFQNLAFEQQAISIVALKEILANRQKAERTEKLRTKTLCVNESRTASGILHFLSYDYFCIIHIMDNDCNIAKTLTEVQVLDALTRYGIRIKYKDI
jgi:stage IV sporulation protein FB